MAAKSLYDYEEEKQKGKKKSKEDLYKKKGKKKKMKNISEPSNQINEDNEIIIGVTVHPSSRPDKKYNEKLKKSKGESYKNKKIKSKKAKTKRKKTTNSIERNILYNIQTDEFNEQNAKYKKKTTKANKIIRWTSIAVLIIGAIIFTMLSPIFNVKDIMVIGNNKLTSEKIIGMSNLEIGQNVFRINKNEIKKRLKQNGYIDDVKIKRNLPDAIELIIEERIPSFAIEYGNGYVIINNQGYIIEITDEKKDIPNLVGTYTPEEDYKENNRLNNQDLNNLSIVLKIINAASSNGIESLISAIDISNLNNIKIELESENKVAYLGDCSNLVHRIQWVKTILENRQGVAGEIIVDMNLNVKDPYFRESIR